MKVSYEGVGEVMATFEAENVIEGEVVCMADSGRVRSCADGEDFCGVVAAVSEDRTSATVQIGGVAYIPCYDAEWPAAGYCRLCADGNGAVRVDENARERLVLSVGQSGNGMAVVL